LIADDDRLAVRARERARAHRVLQTGRGAHVGAAAVGRPDRIGDDLIAPEDEAMQRALREAPAARDAPPFDDAPSIGIRRYVRSTVVAGAVWRRAASRKCAGRP
jgi:hypothetical protein